MKIDKNSKEILFSGSTTLVYKILGLLLNYLVILYITKTYGASIFGKYSLSVSLTQIIAVLFSMGFPILVVKMVSDTTHFDNKPKTDFLEKKLKLLLLVGLIVSVILYFSATLISTYLFKDVAYEKYLKALSLFVIPVLLYEFFLGYYKGTKHYKKHNLFLFIFPSVFLFGFSFLLKQYLPSNGFVFICYLLAILSIVVIQLGYFFSSKPKTNKLKKVTKKELLKSSLPMMFSGFLLFLLSLTDVFMLEILKSSTEVGIYNAAFKVASLGFIFITAINVVIAPKIAVLFHKEQLQEMHKVIVQATRLISLLTLPLVIIIILFRSYILGYFGEEFISGEQTLVYIVLGILFSAMCGTVDQILNMTNNQRILRNIVITSFFLNVILNYILIPKYGINGAALASLVTNVLLNSLCVYFIKRKLGFFTFI